jgi:hypothetical protein
MRRKLVLSGRIACLLVALALCGCGDDGPTNAAPVDPIVVPLAVGNWWVYDTTITPKTGTTETDTTTIVGTENLYGEMWYVFVGSLEDDTLRVRQEGQNVYIVPRFGDDDPESENPAEEYLQRQVEESVPWKYADLDAASGTEWTLAEAETTFEFQVGDQMMEGTLELSIRMKSLGRTTVSVPAGEFSDAYRGSARQLVVFSTSTGTDSMTADRDIWIVDGVGVVKTEEVSTNPEGTETFTQVLQSYQVD